MKQEELEKSLFDQCIKIIKSKNDNKQSFGNIIHKNKKEVLFDHMADARVFNLMHVIVLELLPKHSISVSLISVSHTLIPPYYQPYFIEITIKLLPKHSVSVSFVSVSYT